MVDLRAGQAGFGRFVRGSFLIVLLLAPSACTGGGAGRDQPATPPLQGESVLESSPETAAPGRIGADRREVINVGEIPWTAPERLKRIYEPICRYLSEQLDRQFVFNVSPDYGSLQRDMAEGNIQLGIFSPGAFVDAQAAIPDRIRYLATLRISGSFFYKGYIFARRDSNLNSIQSLRGKSIAFTDAQSSSGYRFPLALLLEQGIEPRSFFSEIYFVGTHEKVLEAVFLKKVAAGAAQSTDFLDRPPEWRQQMVILQEPQMIPHGALAASTQIPDPLFKRIQSLLAGLGPSTRLRDGTPVLQVEPGGERSFIVKDASIYQGVARVSRLVAAYERRLPSE